MNECVMQAFRPQPLSLIHRQSHSPVTGHYDRKKKAIRK